MRSLLILLLLISGCSVMPQSTGAVVFDSCKAADGITTMVAVKSGKFMELNPLFKGIAGGSMSWIPFVGVMTGLILLYNYADNSGYISEPAAVAGNSITCAVAARNIFLMVK